MDVSFYLREGEDIGGNLWQTRMTRKLAALLANSRAFAEPGLLLQGLL